MKAAFIWGGVARHANQNANALNHVDTQNVQNNQNTTHNLNATPTRRRLSKSTPLRPALQQRDNNVMMRVPPNKPPLGSRSSNMSQYEKSTGTSRPLMPSLSASAAKASHKTPITPRVAGSATQNATTPLSRRNPRPDVGQREDLPTPVSSFITPRSGPRKSRIDSTNTTPTGTPTGSHTPSTNEPFRMIQDAQVYGLGINGVDKDVPKRPTVSFSSALSEVSNSRASVQNADSKFFFASDAKTVQPPARPSLVAKPSSTFLYANGEPIPPPQSSSASASGSLVGEERSTSKFFHANGTPDVQLAASPHFPPPRPSSVVSSSSRMASPRIGTSSPAGTLSPPQRPSSPTKLNQHASLSSIRTAPSLPSPAFPRPPPLGRGNSNSGIVSARRASIEAQKITSHGRTSSVTSIATAHIRKVSGGGPSDISAPSTPLSVITNTLPVSTPEEINGDADNGALSEVQSPIKAGHSLEKMNELAAEARRERKVLDLEITNSSLEAINRTLEREMRKVTAELRRYRRLSRSGRLSIGPTSTRVLSDSLSIEDMSGNMLSDMSEEEVGEDGEEESELSEDDSPDEGSLSPTAMAENDLKHRKRDEKRLQLDLTKHQQLLIDSQKMNQSLKRCLGWSESMINEGKKALEYRVRVTDVELGGRVLALDEVEDRNAEQDNEGMSDIGARLLREAREKAAAAAVVNWGSEGSVDRDSGIELRASRHSFGDEEQ